MSGGKRGSSLKERRFLPRLPSGQDVQESSPGIGRCKATVRRRSVDPSSAGKTAVFGLRRKLASLTRGWTRHESPHAYFQREHASIPRTVDVFGVFAAGPVAMVLRDPSLFSAPALDRRRLLPNRVWRRTANGDCVSLGQKSLHDHLSAREVRSVVAASLAATALTAVAAFSLDRLNYVPRSLPLIQLLVLCSLMLGGRALAMRRRGFAAGRAKNHLLESHTLLVGANDFAFSYLKMLDAFDVDRTNIVAILDRNPRLFGRAFLSHPIIGPPSAIARVVREYKVHGVDITRVLICENRPKEREDGDIAEYCASAGLRQAILAMLWDLSLVNRCNRMKKAQVNGKTIGFSRELLISRRPRP